MGLGEGALGALFGLLLGCGCWNHKYFVFVVFLVLSLCINCRTDHNVRFRL